MSRMENDAKDFLLRIVRTIIAALLWLIVNVFIGIYMGWMFFYESPTTGNYIFYCWMLISLVVLLFYFRKLWNRPLISDINSDTNNN
jgi:hypothetical protein